MNYSRQREALKKVLCSPRTHPTAEWLYTELRKEYPNISIGTVYRNLAQLSEAGEILRLSLGNSSDHYDGFVHEHHHFVCTECGAIIDVELDCTDVLNASVRKQIGAEPERKILIFYGKCKDCKNPENCKNADYSALK